MRALNRPNPHRVHWAVLAVAVLLHGSLGSAHAAQDCPSVWRDAPTGDPTCAMLATRSLEAAWNAGDWDGALALFADDVVAINSTGKRFQGRAELAFLLASMWIPDGVSGEGASETIGRCADGGAVKWSFRYQAAGGICVAEISVNRGQAIDFFRALDPADTPTSGLVLKPIQADAAPQIEMWLGAAVMASAITLLIIGATVGDHQQANRGRLHSGRLLRALHEAIVAHS
jgi:hypothetical protein